MLLRRLRERPRTDEHVRAEEVGEDVEVLRGGIERQDPDRDVRLPDRSCFGNERITVVLRVVEVAHQHE